MAAASVLPPPSPGGMGFPNAFNYSQGYHDPSIYNGYAEERTPRILGAFVPSDEYPSFGQMSAGPYDQSTNVALPWAQTTWSFDPHDAPAPRDTAPTVDPSVLQNIARLLNTIGIRDGAPVMSGALPAPPADTMTFGGSHTNSQQGTIHPNFQLGDYMSDTDFHPNCIDKTLKWMSSLKTVDPSTATRSRDSQWPPTSSVEGYYENRTPRTNTSAHSTVHSATSPLGRRGPQINHSNECLPGDCWTPDGTLKRPFLDAISQRGPATVG